MSCFLCIQRDSLQEHSLHMATLAKNSSVAPSHYYRIFPRQALNPCCNFGLCIHCVCTYSLIHIHTHRESESEKKTHTQPSILLGASGSGGVPLAVSDQARVLITQSRGNPAGAKSHLEDTQGGQCGEICCVLIFFFCLSMSTDNPLCGL